MLISEIINIAATLHVKTTEIIVDTETSCEIIIKFTMRACLHAFLHYSTMHFKHACLSVNPQPEHSTFQVCQHSPYMLWHIFVGAYLFFSI